jgi:hypothetical protein
VTLYALGLAPVVADSFGQLSRYTGGEFFAAQQAGTAIERIQAILAAEFGHLEFDGRVRDAWRADPAAGLDALAERLASSRPAVSAAFSRLGARGLLAYPIGVISRPGPAIANR